ncbi:unnamed protein product [Cuscuta campestris]|uniref:Integrase catalytic domain-containing protein n=1 Tax=Cuscuta campestris TaxID=132261 RepID=A0A484N3J0_9ASTE|nr:unnamed protein product [Cuscuta campestris]
MVNNMDHDLPKFSLLGYDDWKIMMEAHLYALHDCMWMVLEDGPFKTLDPITFSRIKHLKTAMEIWQGLGKLCEGSEDLRKQKIEVLLEKFKSFKMLPGESFDMLDERFHKILNDLASLNHVLSPKEKNVRLLRSLPTEWYTKATAMEEGRNLENYTVQGLLDELRTYEHELKKKKEEQVTPFPTALMTTPKVPSREGTSPRNCDTPSSSQPSSSKMENYDEEFAMMVKQFRKFKKFFKKADSVRRPSRGKPQVEKYGERERNEKKKKAMVAAESDESSSSSSDEEALVCMERRVEKSNHEDRWTMSEDDTLCLMAKDDADQEVTSQTSCSSSYESIPTSENLLDQFKKMMEDFEEINLKHSSLTVENKLLSEENLKLTEGRKSQLNEITQLKTENESLSEKVKSLNKELGILKSKEAVDKLLESTKHKGREGLGFNPSSSKRKGRTTFIPPKPTAKPNKQKGKEKEKPTEVPKKEAAKYPGVWYLDSGCSRHMTGDASLLSNLIPYDGPRVTFGGSNDFGLTKGPGNLVYKGLTIQAVSYVEGLNYNLLSISQFCDKGYSLEFCKDMASLKNISTNEVILTGKRIRNIYEVMWDNVKEACLISKGDTNLLWLWHKRLSHLNFKTLNKLSKEGLVEGLPKAAFRKESICDACQKGKQVKSTFKAKPAPSTTRILSLIHMDLFGPVTPISLSGKKYVLVVVDDYSRYTWTIFLNGKKETQGKLTNCMKMIQNQASQTIQKIRSDKGTEFLNEIIIHYCEENGILHQTSAARTPQQNGVAERRNRTLKEAVVGANVHFQKLEAKCSSPTFFQNYLEMIAAQELSEFLQMEIRLKFEEEVLEFYRNGEVKTAHSKKDPQRTFPVIKSTVGGTKVKLSQKKLGEKLRLPNSGVEIGKFPVKKLDWNIIGISGQVPSGAAKKEDLNNDCKLVLELVIACLECGSGGHADDITHERAFIINSLITKTKVNWAAHFFKSISKHLGKHNQKYLCQGLYIGHILESLGAASKGKKYEARYWLYYLSSKGENSANASATAEESSSDNVPLINLAKTAKRKHVVSPSPSVEAPQNLALLYYDWKAWKVGNSAEQLLNWDQQLKNKKIIKKCLGIPVNHNYEQILDDYWVWQRNTEDLHLEYLANTPVSDFEADDEDPAVFKPVFSKDTEDQVILTSEAQGVLEATAEDFQTLPETSHASEMVPTEVVQEKATSLPQEQNQETAAEEEFQQLIQSQVLEILTTPCEIFNPAFYDRLKEVNKRVTVF